MVWGEYRIRLRRDENFKRKRIEQELMRSGGYRGGSVSTGMNGLPGVGRPL